MGTYIDYCVRCGEDKLFSQGYPKGCIDCMLTDNIPVAIDMTDGALLPKFMKKVDISKAQVKVLKDVQGNACKICLRAFSAQSPACVDHDHRHGHVRGLLCRSCNAMLGMSKDNDQTLLRAARYLREQQVHEYEYSDGGVEVG